MQIQRNDVAMKQGEALALNASRLELVLVTFLAVALPLCLRHPQWFLGTAVNAALIYGAMRASHWTRLLPLIVLPSLAALAGGALFGPGVARAMLFVVPAIWLGNAALIWMLRASRGKGLARYTRSLAAAALVKTAIIGAWTAVVAGLGVLSWEFVFTFVLLQVLTAVAGGVFSLPVAARR